MKVKLLRIIWRRAKECAHITSISCSWNVFGITGRSMSVGYCTKDDYNNYHDIEATDEDTFDRKVRQRYWELNRDSYYKKYKR